MTRRAACVLAVVAACGAQLGGGDSDGTNIDGAISRDASVDAPIDARPCTGGNRAMVGPDGSCFVHVETPRTYLQAKTACEAMNAHLAYLKSATVDTFAEQFIGAVDTWIGGSDRANEGTFLWEDGTAFAFTNWHAGEPNNSGGDGYQEDCVIIAGARVDKQWDDRPCDASEVATSGNFAYLCNY